jgi:hypothetical protein
LVLLPSQVVSGFDLLAGADCMVETPPGLGLAVLSAPEPLHYYSLFSHTIGYDVVVRHLKRFFTSLQKSLGFSFEGNNRRHAGLAAVFCSLCCAGFRLLGL